MCGERGAVSVTTAMFGPTLIPEVTVIIKYLLVVRIPNSNLNSDSDVLPQHAYVLSTLGQSHSPMAPGDPDN